MYPAKRDRIDLKDEIMLKNAKKEGDISLVKSLTKSLGGAFVNDLKISSHEVPGNFGVRVVETMPTNLRDVCIEQRNNIEFDFKCDYRFQEIPVLLEQPDTNDYLTDEESDDAGDFELKVPELDDLIS